MRLPEDVIEEVLLRLGVKELLLASQVSSSWNRIVKSKQFLKRKFKRERINLPRSVWDDNLSIKFYLSLLKNSLVPYEKNLLHNSSGEEEVEDSPQLRLGNRVEEDFDINWFRGWRVWSSGGQGWRLMQQDGIRYFVTSYMSCTKEQVINLEEKGIAGWILDTLRPEITFEEQYSASPGHGGCYECRVGLLDAERKTLYAKKDRCETESFPSWRTWKGTFVDYPKGVRNIMFYHGGFADDMQEGWWGTRMTGAKVTIAFPKSSS